MLSCGQSVIQWSAQKWTLVSCLQRWLLLIAGLLRHTFIVGSVAEFVKVCAYVGIFMFYCAFMGQAAWNKHDVMLLCYVIWTGDCGLIGDSSWTKLDQNAATLPVQIYETSVTWTMYSHFGERYVANDGCYAMRLRAWQRSPSRSVAFTHRSAINDALPQSSLMQNSNPFNDSKI